MIFSSLQYLLFLPIVAFLYWRTAGGARLALVVVASYIFYMSWLPVYGVLLCLLTTANWLLGLALGRTPGRTAAARLLLGAGLLLNLGCLCYYKYTNFFLSIVVDSLSWLHLQWAPVPAWQAPMLDVLLPLGISFFVFEFVHYLVDIYRGDKPVRSWMEFTAFASFFPSQIAGPIKRYQDFIDRLREPTPLSRPLFNEAMGLIVQGMFKKVAIADPFGTIVYYGFTAAGPMSAADAWIASVGFVIQVYCDFSGYTDIGRGSALLLGIRLPENFQLPYLAHDIGDFWRRWHMSLGSWLRDYVYIPLGGSRGGTTGTWRNLFLTMVACGLWHGAAWHYVIFGAMQGAALVVNRIWANLAARVKPVDAALNTWAGRQFGTFLTMLFITVSYTVFRAPDMPSAMNVLASWFHFGGECTLGESLWKSGVLQLTLVYMGFWTLTAALKEGRIKSLPIWGADGSYIAPVRAAAWTAAVIFMVAAKPIEATPFVYFQF